MKQSVPEENEGKFFGNSWKVSPFVGRHLLSISARVHAGSAAAGQWLVGKAKQTNMAKNDLCFSNLIPTHEPKEIDKLLIKTRTCMRRQMIMMVWCCWGDLLLVFKLGEALISCTALRLNGLNSSSYRPNTIVRVTVESGGESNQRDWCTTKFTLQYGFEINHFQWL